MAINWLFLGQIYFGKMVYSSLNHDILMYKCAKRISYDIDNCRNNSLIKAFYMFDT